MRIRAGRRVLPTLKEKTVILWHKCCKNRYRFHEHCFRWSTQSIQSRKTFRFVPRRMFRIAIVNLGRAKVLRSQNDFSNLQISAHDHMNTIYYRKPTFFIYSQKCVCSPIFCFTLLVRGVAQSTERHARLTLYLALSFCPMWFVVWYPRERLSFFLPSASSVESIKLSLLSSSTLSAVSAASAVCILAVLM